MSKKTNLFVAGNLIITRDGKARLVADTVDSGLIAMTADGKGIRADKLDDDLKAVEYKSTKDVMKVYGPMQDISGRLFETTNRPLLFDRDAVVATTTTTTTQTMEGTGMTKANVVAGMLVVTKDGKKRLVLPTADKGLVAADKDAKFICLDKMNDDLTIKDYKKDEKNIMQVYSVADGTTTDFYSTEGRTLLFDRNASSVSAAATVSVAVTGDVDGAVNSLRNAFDAFLESMLGVRR